jgi:hypothetical protein
MGAATAALSAVETVETAPDPRAQVLALGLDAERAWRSAMNGRSP